MRFPDRAFVELSEIASAATTRLILVPVGELSRLLNWVQEITEEDGSHYRGLHDP